ncbi:TPA: RidA family protein [Photobacterium damselae]
MRIGERLKELGLELPEVSLPQGNYTNCVRSGNLLFVSGKGPTGYSAFAREGMSPQGKIGADYSTEQGYQFAKETGLEILAVVKAELGTLGRVRRVVKLQGFINATSEFSQHPQVMDGCSDLMIAVFDDIGIHARSVFGSVSVRDNLPLVIDSIFEVE